ncbi:cytochrome P450 [Amylocystis lapponica]|nr:cytochrome P450 [Amylocystis lapponica]
MVQVSKESTVLLAGATVLILFQLVQFIRRGRRVQTAISNVPGPKPASFWTGNYTLLHDAEKGWAFFNDMFSYGNLCRITTPFGCNDMLHLADPLALRHMFRKNDYSFDDPPEVYITLQMVLGNRGLGSTIGPLHKKQRRLLNPVFGSAHLRNMTPILFNVTRMLRETFLELCGEGTAEIDMVHWSSRTALEIIGQSALGHSFDPLTKDSVPTGYGAILKSGFAALSTPTSRLGMKYLLPLFASMATPRFNNWLLRHMPTEAGQRVNNFCETMDGMSREIYAGKKKLFLQDPEQLEKGRDAMSILVRENMRSTDEDHMDEEEIISHITSIVFGGTDTTSSALLRTMWLLAEHPEDQERLRQEIQAAKVECKGEISYDQLLSLPFLDAVYRESIRLYPPVPYQDRMAVKDIMLPLGNPIKGRDGQEIKEIFVPSGTVVAISIVGTNRNTEIWGADALEWNPKRWLGELPTSVKDSGVPGAYSSLMTFLDGRRTCLGMRYVQAEMKALLFDLVGAIRFSPAPDHAKISWPMGIVVSPSVDGKMAMPLCISRA